MLCGKQLAIEDLGIGMFYIDYYCVQLPSNLNGIFVYDSEIKGVK